jgi:hypothetical protein
MVKLTSSESLQNLCEVLLSEIKEQQFNITFDFFYKKFVNHKSSFFMHKWFWIKADEYNENFMVAVKTYWKQTITIKK